MAFRYYDKQGAPIDFERWKELRKDAEYRTIREYSNGEFKAVIEWMGRVGARDQGLMREYWPLYSVEVHNYLANKDSWVLDPNYNFTMGELDEANAKYEELLAQWTASEFVENQKTGAMELVEEDNLLAPPPPPDLDTPMSEVEIGDDGVGAW